METVLGFPVNANQFNVLESTQTVESQCPREEEVGLVDPRTTRHLRAAAFRAEARGRQAEVQSSATVHYQSRDAQGMSGTCVVPVTSEISSSLFVDDSFSASPVDILSLQSAGPVHYMLETGVNVGDALYKKMLMMWIVRIEFVTKGLVMRGRRGRRGDRAIRPLGVNSHA